MFLSFFTELRQAHVPVTPREYLVLMQALEQGARRLFGRGFLPSVARAAGQGRAQSRQIRCRFRCVFKGLSSLTEAVEAGRHSRGMAAQARRALSVAGRKSRAQDARLRKADGDLAPAARRTKGAPSGRLEMDRHGGDFAVRRLWRQSRGHPHRPEGGPQPQRGQGLGPARFQGPQRRRGAGAAQHQDRAAPAAPLRARRRGRGTRPRQHDPRQRRARAISTCNCGPSGAMPSRCCCSSTSAARWIGMSRPRENMFSAARSEFKRLEHFYFHNCLYESVWKNNRRRHRRADADAATHQHLRARLSRHFRRRRLDEPARDRHARAARSSMSIRKPAMSGWSGRSAPGRARSGSTRRRRRNGPIRNRPA